MAMDDKGGMSGYSKPKNKPNSKKKIAARAAASKASGMSAQKFYVKTRMAEAAKSGKTLNAKDLRQKFQSGDVARKGFGAPKKKTGGSGGSGSMSSSAGRKAYGGKTTKSDNSVEARRQALYAPSKSAEEKRQGKMAPKKLTGRYGS